MDTNRFKLTIVQHKIRKRKGKLLTKIEEITVGKAHANTQKLNQNILTVTAIFINQKRMNVCEHTTQMISLVRF
jgi:hypothetical protein